MAEPAIGSVDAVIWNTTAPQITEQGFKVLEELLEAYGDQLVEDINELSAMITAPDYIRGQTRDVIPRRKARTLSPMASTS